MVEVALVWASKASQVFHDWQAATTWAMCGKTQWVRCVWAWVSDPAALR